MTICQPTKLATVTTMHCNSRCDFCKATLKCVFLSTLQSKPVPPTVDKRHNTGKQIFFSQPLYKLTFFCAHSVTVA